MDYIRKQHPGIIIIVKIGLWFIGILDKGRLYVDRKFKNAHPVIKKILKLIAKPEVQIALILSYKFYNSSKTKHIINGLKMVKGIIVEEIHASCFDFITNLF